jgi:hypothetical protein
MEAAQNERAQGHAKTSERPSEGYNMVGPHALITRVSPEIKRRVGVAAARQLITPSVWLRRVIVGALESESAHAGGDLIERSMELPRHRLSIRIRRGDALLLKARLSHGA